MNQQVRQNIIQILLKKRTETTAKREFSAIVLVISSSLSSSVNQKAVFVIVHFS